MALIDKGMDDQFKEDLSRASLMAYEEALLDYVNDFSESIEWLLKDAHKSDIGVVHRLIRDKLSG